tara:strand:- start:4937 stop:5794 length:858 start_codon:yes stop_codon:yes gene_type:complete
MKYKKFFAMILTSTFVMFGLMYLNTYALEHVFFSETRAYMALLMGAAMAFVMLAFMSGMYRSRAVNTAIFVGAVVVFAASLWLVRSQATVSGVSYLRAMIPHHSIAIMTSERAGIEDARVRKLADEIIAAQRREIAEMRYMIASIERGETSSDVYQDPPAAPGTMADVLAGLRLATLDPAPMSAEEAAETGLSSAGGCAFRTSTEVDPILRTAGDAGSMKLNGVLLSLAASPRAGESGGEWRADGVVVKVSPQGEDADWRSDAELVFKMQSGPTVGYHGFWSCGS